MTTVKSCVKAKDWTSPDGKVVPFYTIELTDGRSGQSTGKIIPEGTPVEDIEITESNYGLKFKLKNKGGGFRGGGGAPKGNESFALSYAKDLACAHISQGKEYKAGEILKVADEFYNWMESKKK